MDAAGERRRRRATRTPSTAGARTASGCSPRSSPTTRSSSARRARSSSACATTGRSTTSRRARRSSTGSSRGTRCRSTRAPGIVHIAPGCGGEDFELGKRARPAGAHAGRRGGPLLRRLRLAARPLDDRGGRPDHRRARRDAASSSRPARYEHRYPHCWRCDTPLIFRLSDDWFISVDEIRAEAARGEREGRVGARVHGQAHGRLAAQHGRLEHLAPPLLRPAAAVLPVLVRPPERDRLEGRARRARDRGLRPARGAAPPVDRPRADPLRGVRRAGRRASPRSATSGSTPASSRSRRSAGRTRSGSTRATRPAPRKG